MRAEILVALVASLCACAHAPQCDYSQLVGKCSAAIDTVGNQAIVSAEQCAEVDVEVAGRLRTIRPASRGHHVSDTATPIDIKECRLYQQVEVSQSR